MGRKKKKQKDKKLITYMASIGAILLLLVALFQWGLIGIALNRTIHFLVGDYYYAVCVLCIIAAGIFIFDKQSHRKIKLIIALISLIAAIVLWSALMGNGTVTGWTVFENFIARFPEYFITEGAAAAQGGFIGALLYSLTSVLIAKEGTGILIVGLVILAFLLIMKLEFFKDVWNSIRQFFTVPKEWREESQNDGYAEEEYEEELDFSEEEYVEDTHEEVEEPSVIKSFEKPKKNSLFMDVDDIGYGSSLEKETLPESNAVKSTTPTTMRSIPVAKTEGARKVPYRLPSLSLLESQKSRGKNGSNEVAAKQKGENLIRILDNFGIKAELLATHIGPSVTKFELKPDATVKVSKINSISDNIKMELAAKDIRIEAPIPGRNAVGVEIPNVESTAVRISSLIKSIPNELQDKKTLIALGKDLMGRPVYCDMHKMPHLLVAGATGSGKSVCMNTIITSLLLRTKPQEVKLLLIDPKKVEFTPYREIPHLIAPVISDSAEAAKALKVVVNIMEERYDTFSAAGVRNIDSFNQKVKEFPQDGISEMPYIIVIIDELADLMAIAGKEVEMSIQRITQLARAAGIHLIVATQRPSTDVITGIIKANVPSRIAFSVSSGIDSRTILDSVGAERLLGNGDMLYQPIGASAPTRLQGAYVSDEEVNRITTFCAQQEKPFYNDQFLELDGVENNVETSIVKAEDDPIYQEIKEYVVEVQKASTSLLQRRFGLGYNRAARMVDLLEDRGIVGPARGSKPREVYMKKEDL